MTVKATIIADSISDHKKRLTTFELYYPRFVHSEFMTHRVFSRNAASSRAIPITTFIDMIRKDPAMPERWGKNGNGMQDHGVMSPENEARAKSLWLGARDDAIKRVGMMMKLPEVPHKQIVNRLLEPWMHIRVVVSSTSYDNFFALRRHKDAQPEIKALADAMWAVYSESKPVLLKPGAWHLPYIEQHEWDAVALSPDPEAGMDNLRKVSVARCARTSFKTHRDKVSTLSEDSALFDRLVGQVPLHASPAEHQATPDTRALLFNPETRKFDRPWACPEQHGNFDGWLQFRKMLPGENVTTYINDGEI